LADAFSFRDSGLRHFNPGLMRWVVVYDFETITRQITRMPARNRLTVPVAFKQFLSALHLGQ